LRKRIGGSFRYHIASARKLVRQKLGFNAYSSVSTENRTQNTGTQNRKQNIG